MRQDAGAPRVGESPSPDLLANIEAIAAYTAIHPELRRAHHFIYDLRSPPGGTPSFVIMGINPGETERDWRISPTPTEETSRFDFHRRGTEEETVLRWTKLTRFFLDGADSVLTELFFWSSRGSRELEERYGPLATSPHLAFCRDMNRDLIAFYNPRAVILPGLGSAKLCPKLYGLRHTGTVHEGKARVVEAFTDGERPWLFTKHWTGAFGLSAEQCFRIRQAIRNASTLDINAFANTTPTEGGS